MITKVEKWLNENNIEHTSDNDLIEIMIEPNCVWINGFGKPMKYDRKYRVLKNKYRDYFVIEVTGYNLHHQHCWTKKQDTVIDVLSRLLEG